MAEFDPANARAAAIRAGRRRAALKAMELRNAVVMNTPVDTGRLRQSIGLKQMNEDTWRVGTNVEYAPYVEFGTRFQAPAGMFRKALAQVRR